MKILLLDDDDDVQKIVEIQLSRLGHETISAYNGNQAIELYKKSIEEDNPIDIGILDLNIGLGIGGEKVAKQILELDPNAKLIVSSGDTENIIMREYKKYGFLAAMEKNFSLNLIEEKITEVIGIE